MSCQKDIMKGLSRNNVYMSTDFTKKKNMPVRMSYDERSIK